MKKPVDKKVETLKPLAAQAKAGGLLAATSLFASFLPDELASLAKKCKFVSFKDGETIFAEGDPGDRLFVVDEGTIIVSSPEDGATLAEFVRADSFGELEFLTKGKRNATAKASGSTRLLAFPRGEGSLEVALSGNPALAARILRSFLLVIAGRTRKSNALVKENSPWVRELRRQVYGDKLTGLYNKAWLEEQLPLLLAKPLALIMMKPDNFKDLNDRFGHEAGDAALILMAKELDADVAGEGTAVRYMGNELAVVYPGMDKEKAKSAALRLQSMLSALDLSALTGDTGFHFSMSLGIVLSPGHGNEAESLVTACAGLPLAGRERGGAAILFPEDLA